MFNYKNWCNQCTELETNRVSKKLINNNNIEELLTDFSHRLVNKYLDPIYQVIYMDYESDYDPVSSLEWYRINYLDRTTPKPDYVEQ